MADLAHHLGRLGADVPLGVEEEPPELLRVVDVAQFVQGVHDGGEDALVLLELMVGHLQQQRLRGLVFQITDDDGGGVSHDGRLVLESLQVGIAACAALGGAQGLNRAARVKASGSSAVRSRTTRASMAARLMSATMGWFCGTGCFHPQPVAATSAAATAIEENPFAKWPELIGYFLNNFSSSSLTPPSANRLLSTACCYCPRPGVFLDFHLAHAARQRPAAATIPAKRSPTRSYPLTRSSTSTTGPWPGA